ncbi:MAG: CvpA family protein [Betaproteobacteria bacterium]|nr:CvpA family protein [Betaproteobacteria bacterium]
MTWFDIAVFAVVGISVLLGVMRGFIKEVMSLLSWIVAFVLARRFGPAAGTFLPPAIQPAELRLAIGFVGILVASLLVLWLVTYLVNEVFKATGLTGVNRTLGAAFGLARGLFISVVAVLVAGLTSLPETSGWRNAWLSPVFEQVALAARAWLPEPVKANVRYDQD